MSGHSKWSQIKHKKAATDKKKGQLFSKLSKQITIAAKDGGADPAANFKLRLAIEQAKASQMPKDNIDRAIEKASGAGGAELVSINYEGYGPAGTAFIVEVATDSKNRTASEIRHLFDANGGSLGQTNSVTWNFESKGQILVEKGAKDVSDLELLAIEAGAEDVRSSEDGLEVYTAPLDMGQVKSILEKQGLTVVSAEIIMEAKNQIELSESDKQKVQKLFEALSDNEDVVAVHTSAIL